MHGPTNPYQSPVELPDEPDAGRKSPLRFIAAAIMGLLGMAAMAMAVLIVVLWYQFLFLEGGKTHVAEAIIGFSLWLSLGTCWLLSAVLIWQAVYRRALMLGLVGLLILVGIFSLAGL